MGLQIPFSLNFCGTAASSELLKVETRRDWGGGCLAPTVEEIVKLSVSTVVWFCSIQY